MCGRILLESIIAPRIGCFLQGAITIRSACMSRKGKKKKVREKNHSISNKPRLQPERLFIATETCRKHLDHEMAVLTELVRRRPPPPPLRAVLVFSSLTRAFPTPPFTAWWSLNALSQSPHLSSFCRHHRERGMSWSDFGLPTRLVVFFSCSNASGHRHVPSGIAGRLHHSLTMCVQRKKEIIDMSGEAESRVTSRAKTKPPPSALDRERAL